MSFTVSCGVTTAEKRSLDKTMSSVVSHTATLRNESSVVDPVILIDADAGSLAACNYMHIGEFGRYYFITDVIAVSEGLAEVHGHCDVLRTYASYIRKNPAIIGRTANSWKVNNLIVDRQLKVSNKRNVTVQKIGSFEIPSGVNYTYVMLTAG